MVLHTFRSTAAPRASKSKFSVLYLEIELRLSGWWNSALPLSYSNYKVANLLNNKLNVNAVSISKSPAKAALLLGQCRNVASAVMLHCLLLSLKYIGSWSNIFFCFLQHKMYCFIFPLSKGNAILMKIFSFNICNVGFVRKFCLYLICFIFILKTVELHKSLYIFC